MPKSKQFVGSSDESSDSEPKERKNVAKKSKREEESSDEEPKETKRSKKESKKETKRETKKDSDGVWELGNNRHVTVREFKGKLLVDIREMYFDKDGDLKPGKKGISMNMTQWRKFMDIVADVDETVKAKC